VIARRGGASCGEGAGKGRGGVAHKGARTSEELIHGVRAIKPQPPLITRSPHGCNKTPVEMKVTNLGNALGGAGGWALQQLRSSIHFLFVC
jgi:hypothetical protein